MHYQHPELEIVRVALDYGMPESIAEMQRSNNGLRHLLGHTRETLASASH